MAEARTRDAAAIRDLASRISSVDEEDLYAKVLVYGPHGAGKTRFAATAPRCLIIDVNERGTRSARGSGARKIVVGNWLEIGHAYWLLASGKHKFESVAIDTIDGMYGLAMDFVLDEAEQRDPSREKRSPDKRSYGRANQLVRGMLLAFRNLEMHVIFTAHSRVITDEDTNEVTGVTVNMPAGARAAAMDAVGVLGYMEPRQVRLKGKRTWVDQLICGPSALYETKDRTNALGDVLTRPTMPKVIEAWAGNNEENN